MNWNSLAISLSFFVLGWSCHDLYELHKERQAMLESRVLQLEIELLEQRDVPVVIPSYSRRNDR